jgi:perosamine synthetase
MSVTAETVLPALTPRTRAVMAVHFGGLAVDVSALRRALPDHVAIVEDAAHAFGSRYADGRRVGASGNLCCFSFYANKALSTGEGGAIALDDAEGAQRLRSLRQHGLTVDAWKRFTNPEKVVNADLTELGYKANFTDLQASIGRVQLARQEEFGATRAAVAQIYRDGLAGLPLHLQADCTHPAHSRHLFVIVLDDSAPMDRDQLLRSLRERRLGATIHYEPLHTMPLYRRERSAAPLVHTDYIVRNIATLPIGACVTPDDAREVVEAMHELLR